jgi:hypothetical protein
MSISTERQRRLRRALAITAAAVLALLVGSPASAQDGTLRIRESTLDRFATAVGSLAWSQNFTFTLWVPNPFLLPPVVPLFFNCTATARVTGLDFDITPGGTSVRGSVSGGVCGIAYPTQPLTASVAISIDQSQRALIIQPTSMNFQPRVNVLGFGINAPFTVAVSPSITVPPIPLDAAPFEIETAAGPRTFVLVGRNLALSRQNGYLEIRGDVRFR